MSSQFGQPFVRKSCDVCIREQRRQARVPRDLAGIRASGAKSILSVMVARGKGHDHACCKTTIICIFST